MRDNCKNRFFGGLVLLLIIGFIGIGTPLMAQPKRITIQMNRVSLATIIEHIEKNAGYLFVYKSKDVDPIRNLSVNRQNATVREILTECLKNTRLEFTFDKNTVVISQKKDPAANTNSVPSQGNLEGTVTDAAGNPMPGVTILVRGTTLGTTTDDKGRFTLRRPRSGDQIQFSFIGYQAQTITYKGESQLRIKLSEEIKSVDDVVVTGYFTRKKGSFTGSAKTISSDELKTISSTNVVGAIAMLTPGLNIKVNNEAGSNPNQIPELILRGTSSLTTEADVTPNQPMIILDGLEITMSQLYDLDINEIERINVLKDASATSLYGEKAANGVIVIERKAIEEGTLRLSYNFNTLVTFPDLSSYDYLNASEKLNFEQAAKVYNFENKKEFETYNRRRLLASQGLDTDWLSKPLRTGYTLNNAVGISGRTAGGVQYRINANYNTTKGVMRDDSRDTKSLSTFFSYRLKDKVLFSLQSSYGKTSTKASPYGSFSNYVTLNPYDSPYDEYGQLKKILSWDVSNPLYDATVGSYSKTDDQRFTNSLDIRWDILPGFYVTGQGTLTTGSLDSYDYVSPFQSQELQKEISQRGALIEGRTHTDNYSGKVVLNYTHSFSKGVLTLHAGGDIYKDRSRSATYGTRGFMNNALSTPNLAAGYSDGKPSGSDDISTRVGSFANANFIWDDRYFVDGSIRISGSSKFGADNRYGTFWSAGAGWNLHKEKFMENLGFSTLRLHYSYGVTGNVSFPTYQAITTYKFDNKYYYQNGIGTVPITMGNSELTWQTTGQHNIGLNATFWENRIDLSLDYYNRLTRRMLVDITVPPSIGVASLKDNLGRMRNTGIEFDLSAQIIKTGDWLFTLTLNGSHNQNKILAISNGLKKYNDQNKESTGAPKLLYHEGESSTALYAVRSLGINPANGKEVFLTRSGALTEIYNADDKVVLGDYTPKIEGAIIPRIRWRNLSMNISMSYRLGGDIYNTTRADRVENVNPKYNVDRRAYEQRWQSANDIKPYLDISNTADRSTVQTERFVEKDNALTISRIDLTYEFAAKFLKSIGFRRLSVGVGMNDVCRLQGVRYERGTSYPFSRAISFTLSPTF